MAAARGVEKHLKIDTVKVIVGRDCSHSIDLLAKDTVSKKKKSKGPLHDLMEDTKQLAEFLKKPKVLGCAGSCWVVLGHAGLRATLAG